MSIVMGGIDHKTASIAKRERFSISAKSAGILAAEIRDASGADGCVLLSTCNRTELYLSCSQNALPLDPAKLLCEAFSCPTEAEGFTIRRNRQAERHLMMVAAGLRSLIRGEDQILAQVKTSLEEAREAGAVDAVLATLFRCAITAGKKAKATVPLVGIERSTAHRALEKLTRVTNLAGKRALVIGSGEMGQIIAGLLRDAGCRVTVTLRSYKRGSSIVPTGCESIPYDERYAYMPQCSILVSATASPHYTVGLEELQQCAHIPPYMVDLAVPRDIQPEAGALAAAGCWNVDDLGGNSPSAESAQQLMQILEILDDQTYRFEKWRSHRQKLMAELLPTKEH